VNIATNIQVNQLWVVYYYPDEDISNFTPLGTSTVSQQATTLSNVGNASATPIIFAEPVGDSSTTGAVNITNDGKEILGDASHSGSLTVNHETAGSIDQNVVIAGNGLSYADSVFQLIALLLGATDPSITLENHAGTSSFIATAMTPVTHNGSVSGSITLVEPFQGNLFKLAILFFNNYQDAANQSLALPAPFVNDVAVFTIGDIGVAANGGLQLLNGVTAQSLGIISAFALAGGTGNTQTPIYKYSIGHMNNPGGINVDHVQALLNTGAHSGIVLLIGQ
jgi:hypothetical protein